MDNRPIIPLLVVVTGIPGMLFRMAAGPLIAESERKAVDLPVGVWKQG